VKTAGGQRSGWIAAFQIQPTKIVKVSSSFTRAELEGAPGRCQLRHARALQPSRPLSAAPYLFALGIMWGISCDFLYSPEGTWGPALLFFGVFIV